MKKKLNFSQFSNHLFWDTDRNLLDAEQNKKYITKQVLEYGLFTDWQLIQKYYGTNEIAEIATTLSDIEPKALSFISVLSGIPKDKFRCFTSQQLAPKHWNF